MSDTTASGSNARTSGAVASVAARTPAAKGVSVPP
jgi:hypothetical protein